MGVFGDFAQSYLDYGYQPIPIDKASKSPNIKEWTKKFSHELMTDDDLEKWQFDYHSYDLGIATGKASGVIGIDFDYEGFSDSKAIEALILEALPPSPLIKKGKKGWTRFYKYNAAIINKSIRRELTEADRLRHKIARREVVMIDVLSTGRQTVMPPSTHSGELKYTWVSPDTIEDYAPEELPEIDLEHIKFLEELAKTPASYIDESKVKKQDRHTRLFVFVMKRSDYVASESELIQLALEFDESQNKDDPKGLYFSDSKHHTSDDPLKNATVCITRWVQWKRNTKASQGIKWELGEGPTNYWKENKAGVPVQSDRLDDYRHFFNTKFPEACQCHYTGVPYYRDFKGYWRNPYESVKALQSYAREVGLKPGLIEQELERWCVELETRVRIDLPRWDGKDHIAKLISYVSFSNIDNKHAIPLIKEWFSLIWARCYNPEKQNTFLIMKGKQGIGKDYLINHMVEGFSPYFGHIIFQRDKRENAMSLAGKAICYIPEFEDTHASEVSALKTLITSDHLEFRRPYERIGARVNNRASFISSSNFDNLMRDSSGSRRFRIFELESIDWAYRGAVNPMQIAAQAKALYHKNYVADRDSLAAMGKIMQAETPKSPEERAVEFIISLALEQKSMIDESYEKRLLSGSYVNYLGDYFDNKNKTYCLKWKSYKQEIRELWRECTKARFTNLTDHLTKIGLLKRRKSSTFITIPVDFL